MSELSASIAMATYNGGGFLREQLESLCRQTRLPAELVVCDDVSSDDTLEVLRSFQKEAPFTVNVIVNEVRLGYKRNFMKAASSCRGDVIFFCDQDDIWNEQKIATVIQAFTDENCMLISHDFSVFFNDARPSLPSYFDKLESSGYSRAVSIKGCSIAFRRRFLDLIGWPDEHSGWSHDAWITLAATSIGKRSYISLPLIQHRIHGKNVSGWLVGEAGVRRLIRRLHLPPFTSSEDVDRLVDLCFDADQTDEFTRAITQPRVAADPSKLMYVSKALERKMRIKSFRIGENYKAFRRPLTAFKLFWTLNYRVGGGISGLLSDLFGRR